MKKLPISVIILTYNEEKNLPQALESIKDHVEDIIVVDSYSKDETVDIAEEYNARVYQHEFINQAKQFNWALDNIEIENPWIFRLDADEWVTNELWEELEEKLENTPEDVSGYFMKRRVHFMGKWIKHGGYYPSWFLRLFKNGKGKSEDRQMDEHIILTEGKAEELENDIVDENHKGLEFWVDKHNGFSTREVKDVLSEKEEDDKLEGDMAKRRRAKFGLYYKMPKFCRAFLYFIYRYIFRLGFLDGIRGLIFHFLQGCWYRFLVDAKIYEQENKDKH